MKDFISQKEFLKQALINDSKLRIGELKKLYKKEYFREYNRRRKSSKKITVRFTDKEFEVLNLLLQSYTSYSKNSFIVKVVLDYANQNFQPHDPDMVQKIKIELKRIGNNVNQITHKLHSEALKINPKTGGIKHDLENLKRLLKGFEMIKQQIDSINEVVQKYLNSPAPELLNLKWEEIRDSKQKLNQMIEFLSNHRNNL